MLLDEYKWRRVIAVAAAYPGSLHHGSARGDDGMGVRSTTTFNSYGPLRSGFDNIVFVRVGNQ